MILKIPYFKQKKVYTCGPACIQMALAFFNKMEAQKMLEKEMETKRKTGTTHKNMINTAKKKGILLLCPQ